MHRLQAYLEAKSKTIIQESLDQLLGTIRTEAAKITSASVVVLISPEARVTVGSTYSDEDSDPWLRRLKCQDFYILTLPGFSYFIQSLKSEAAKGNWVPVIDLLTVNTKFASPPEYSLTSPVKEAEQPSEPSTSSEWKVSDFCHLYLHIHPCQGGYLRVDLGQCKANELLFCRQTV